MIGTLALRAGRLPKMAEVSPPGESPAKRAADATPRTDAETTFALIRRAHDGDDAARNELCVRYLPRLQRWAHGRLPAWARGALDTHDLVQDTFIQVLHRLEQFEPRHEGAFHAYLRQALLNRVRDEIRRANRRGPSEPLDAARPAADPSPLELAIGQEALDRYEAALTRLRPDDREAIILRIEMGYPYAEIAVALDKPSVPAAQMAVSRALVRLAEELSRERI
jgi:RNA polymerase sigma factor (sigma-70 family)